jgi:hypothetical protein
LWIGPEYEAQHLLIHDSLLSWLQHAKRILCNGGIVLEIYFVTGEAEEWRGGRAIALESLEARESRVAEVVHEI